jgi:hypothetical protein
MNKRPFGRSSVLAPQTDDYSDDLWLTLKVPSVLLKRKILPGPIRREKGKIWRRLRRMLRAKKSIVEWRKKHRPRVCH